MQLKISSSDDTFQYFIITIMCTAGISKNYSSRSWSYVTVWMTNWLLSEESVLLSKFYILLYIRTPWLFDLQIIMSWGPIKMRNQRAKFFINNMLFSSCLCFFTWITTISFADAQRIHLLASFQKSWYVWSKFLTTDLISYFAA